MQHVFIDVEAFGPPGIGRPFALGACKFDQARGIYGRFQRNIAWPGTLQMHQETLDWLTKQSPRVLAQCRDGIPFSAAWAQFREWATTMQGVPQTFTCFWADDWSDFAWLDFESRDMHLKSMRDLGPAFDSSAMVHLAHPPKVYDPALLNHLRNIGDPAEPELIPHMAGHDAIMGALDLLAALKILGRDLP